MTTHSESSEPLLPVVSREVVNDLSEGMMATDELLFDMYDEMQKANPVLAAAVFRYCVELSQGDPERCNDGMLVAALVHKALQAQAERDRIARL